MGHVVTLRPKEAPHATGEARCLTCAHEWVAVAPVGTVWLECPCCGLVHGRFAYHHEREGAAHWQCNFGNDLFQVTQDGIYCPACGVWQNGF